MKVSPHPSDMLSNQSVQTDALYLMSLPVHQIKAIKKAVNVMVRAGIYRDDALRIILEQRRSLGR